ncbi:M28-family zinc peptidase [Geothrix oryzae]|uniref:M28-family zinc peptidase n=1 Tax=Geothrix oryzae TaxID=2927975 RepID=A0ABM8DT57_9BACT|nr:M20/M25/M40 family metallo-hydrolase [Geothrix oryzae]BDU70220.1 M28-family zinc peptidase [Geothrix oryzae]
MRRSLALLALLGSALLAQGPEGDFVRARRPEPLPPGLQAAVDDLDASRLTRHMAFLTDPRREGRGLGTRGLEATARYLASQLKAAGIPPAGASYFQTVPLREVRPEPGAVHLVLHSPAASRTLVFQGGQAAVLPPTEPGTLEGSLVFAGYGIQEPALGHDDFRGLEVRGKVVVFRAGCPPGAAWQKPELTAKYASERPADRYDSRLALLEKLGARAAIALEEDLERRLAEGQEPARPYFLAEPGAPAPGEPPLARVALTAELRALLAPGLQGTATLVTRGRVRTFRSFNVLGKLPGSDPALRPEAVVLGAHMDHLGLQDGRLHPGADDNASGVAALLELARSIAARPVRPRRTLLFAFWTGEEEGKFGSGHYTRHPAWPLARTKAYLNLDMIAHPWTPAELDALAAGSGLKDPRAFFDGLDPAHFAEPGLSPGPGDLGPVLARAGRGMGMSLHLDWTDGRSGGSDYRDFARLGVPFVRFFGSYFPGYHQPSDTLDRLDPGQVRRMGRLVLATAWLLADRP